MPLSSMQPRRPQNLLRWQDLDKLQRVDAAEQPAFDAALRDLLFGDRLSFERLERFNQAVWPTLQHHLGGNPYAFSRGFPTLLLMLHNPDEDIFVRTDLFSALTQRLLGRNLLENRMFDAGQYRAVLDFANLVRHDLEAMGWQPRDMIDVQSFLWTAGQPGSDKQRLVKIAPGAKGKFWPDCLEGGYICVGWDDIGDLRQYESKEAFRAAFREHYSAEYNGQESTISRKANEVWTLRELQFGDRVVANRGTSEVLAVGTVMEPGYEWRPDRSEFRHTVRVEWDTSVAKVIPPQKSWATVTVAPVSAELYNLITGSSPTPPSPPPQAGFDAIMAALRSQGLTFAPELVSNYLLALQTKRFVIFTGISGTGKTRLAMAVANHFGRTIDDESTALQASEPPQTGEFLRLVKPYMLDTNTIVLPRRLTAQIDFPPAEEGKLGAPIDVLYPGGKTHLRYTRESTQNQIYLTFKDDFKDWFRRTFKVGDPLFIAMERLDGKPHHAIRFRVPDRGAATQVPVDNYSVIPVRPDWTDNRGLLGFHNPITGRYVTTDFLRLLLRAMEHPEHPFFVVLDEMNLARVEHYFSDFLSAMESGQPIELHNDSLLEAGEMEDGIAIPRALKIPPNVFFTGTVNVDETTYMFSPKVLDRAFTLEFNDVDLQRFGDGTSVDSAGLKLTGLPGVLRFERLPRRADWTAFGELLGGELRDIVVQLNTLLADEHRHFGYRVANEIARFVTLAAEQADGEDSEALWDALDLAVLQKVLPKFHGTQQELEEVLLELLAFAIRGERVGNPEERRQLEEQETEGTVRLPRTAAKVRRMLRRVRRQGFTSYVE
jgi:hypothetical protein